MNYLHKQVREENHPCGRPPSNMIIRNDEYRYRDDGYRSLKKYVYLLFYLK